MSWRNTEFIDSGTKITYVELPKSYDNIPEGYFSVEKYIKSIWSPCTSEEALELDAYSKRIPVERMDDMWATLPQAYCAQTNRRFYVNDSEGGEEREWFIYIQFDRQLLDIVDALGEASQRSLVNHSISHCERLAGDAGHDTCGYGRGAVFVTGTHVCRSLSKHWCEVVYDPKRAARYREKERQLEEADRKEREAKRRAEARQERYRRIGYNINGVCNNLYEITVRLIEKELQKTLPRGVRANVQVGTENLEYICQQTFGMSQEEVLRKKALRLMYSNDHGKNWSIRLLEVANKYRVAMDFSPTQSEIKRTVGKVNFEAYRRLLPAVQHISRRRSKVQKAREAA